jgi:hypothetical protein
LTDIKHQETHFDSHAQFYIQGRYYGDRQGWKRPFMAQFPAVHSFAGRKGLHIADGSDLRAE